MPLRKNVIDAPWSAATLRNRENSWLLSSPAPSQENTTNCGGRVPAASRVAFGCFGWAPVSAVEPSPIGRTGLACCVAAPPAARPPPALQVPFEQAERAPRAPAVAPAVSMRLREMPLMFVPEFLVTGPGRGRFTVRSSGSMCGRGGKIGTAGTRFRAVTVVVPS